MTEEEALVVIEDKQSLSSILSSKDKVILEIEEFILKEEHNRDDSLINYGKLECLFLMNAIDEKLFIKLTETLSNLLKEKKEADEA